MTGAPRRKSPHAESLSITEGACTYRPVAVFHRIGIYVGGMSAPRRGQCVRGPDSRPSHRHRGPGRAAPASTAPPNRRLLTAELALFNVSGGHGQDGVQTGGTGGGGHPARGHRLWGNRAASDP